MKNLLVIFILIGMSNLVKAQFSFESKLMTKIYGDEEKVKRIHSKITINSDTTEITVIFKNTIIKEKIGKIYHRQINGIYKLFMYEKETPEWGKWIILHFTNNILHSVVFQENGRHLIFE